MINNSFRITKTLQDNVVSIHKLDDNLVTRPSCIFANVLINGGMFGLRKRTVNKTHDIISSQNEFAALLVQLKLISHFFQQPLRHRPPEVPDPLFYLTDVRHKNIVRELS